MIDKRTEKPAGKTSKENQLKGKDPYFMNEYSSNRMENSNTDLMERNKEQVEISADMEQINEKPMNKKIGSGNVRKRNRNN